MMGDRFDYDCDLAVIGAGMAGMSAALFAANRGLSTLQCGSSSGLMFASGMLDVLAIYPVEKKRRWDNPWAAIDYLKQNERKHPYTRIPRELIDKSLQELLTFFENNRFPYHFSKGNNALLPTGQGTVKPSYLVPRSMWQGVIALSGRKPCVLIDFAGMKEFSAHQVTESLKTFWPDLRSVQVIFPGMEKQLEVHPEHMARALENEDNRAALAGRLAVHIKNETFVGLPAVLGMRHHIQILERLEKDLGVSIFEIPTPAVSVSGMRLKEFFERHLPDIGVVQLSNSKVSAWECLNDGRFLIQVRHHGKSSVARCKGVILASGKFFGGGLRAYRQGIRETLFDLPVSQPSDRAEWHRIEFFDRRGHPVNRSGLEVDGLFRPVNKQGKPVFDNLFAAGSILAHQDWIREKSGSGIAVASAYSAVEGFLREHHH